MQARLEVTVRSKNVAAHKEDTRKCVARSVKWDGKRKMKTLVLR